jgi:sterol desaturase/sphingolipid hydroxylase (fatty acid hydroxylase superfamily)
MNSPSPLDVLLDPLMHYIAIMYVVLMLWEALFPARKLADINYWKIKGIAVCIFYFLLSVYLPLFIKPILEPLGVMDLSMLGTFKGALVGVLLYEFGFYLWHRQLHRSDFLWKTLHQVHHCAERVCTSGAFFFSPLNTIGWAVLSSVFFSLIMGLSPQAITATLLITNFLSIFQRANIDTPQWIGYFVQRPESHAVHNTRDIRRSNYSDLPLFDILFGTFTNPTTFIYETGFYNRAPNRMNEMLLAKNASRPDNTKQKISTFHPIDLS